MYLYSRERGWEQLHSTLDEAQSLTDLEQRLHKLGFPEPEEFSYRVGTVHLYTRHVSLPKYTPLAFSFCCMLELGGYSYCVGMKTLEDTLAFLTLIEARSLQSLSVQQVTLKEIERLSEPLSDLVTTLHAPLTIKHLADLKLLIERLISLLTTISPGAFKESNGMRQREQGGILPESFNGKAASVPGTGSEGKPPATTV